MKKVIKIDVPLDLDATLSCGQTFRWNKEDGKWYGVVDNALLILEQRKNELIIVSSSEELFNMDLEKGIKYYLGISDNLDYIRKNVVENLRLFGYYEQSALMNEVFQMSYGLRILRQDPWEMFIEYIISTRNNIPTIKKTIEALCKLFPENRQEFHGKEFFVFPSLKQLRKLTIDDLVSIKLAFRAQWIYDTVRSVDLNRLYSLKEESFQKKLDYLLSFRGVGYKVASCVMLFSMEELSAFPVDVWIRRMMKNLFGVEGNTKKIMELGMRYFGPFAGYAQEYLFRYFREIKRKTERC